MVDWYYLDAEKRPVKFADLDEMIAWHKANPLLVENQKRVASTDWGPFWVSTVFLGLDHSHEEGSPVLFETMIFLRWPWSVSDVDCERSSTWEEAEAMHETMVEDLRTWKIWRSAWKRLMDDVSLQWQISAPDAGILSGFRKGRVGRVFTVAHRCIGALRSLYLGIREGFINSLEDLKKLKWWGR